MLAASGKFGVRAQPAVHIRLQGGFELSLDRRPVHLPRSVQRLLAFLALNERPLLRVYVAGKLWTDNTEERAAGNLRSAIWRAQRPECTLVNATTTHVSLVPSATVDAREARSLAERILRQPGGSLDLNMDVKAVVDSGDLLPDWYDDWVWIERERLRQLSLHAMELLCLELTRAGELAKAVQAGVAAVSREPLRESAQRALIGVYLAEGNQTEAIRQYRVFETLLRDELGLEPTQKMRTLVGPLNIR